MKSYFIFPHFYKFGVISTSAFVLDWSLELDLGYKIWEELAGHDGQHAAD